MKVFLIEITSRYLDGTSETEIIRVRAYSSEHAEERAFDLCGGESGGCQGVTFRTLRAL